LILFLKNIETRKSLKPFVCEMKKSKEKSKKNSSVKRKKMQGNISIFNVI